VAKEVTVVRMITTLMGLRTTNLHPLVVAKEVSAIQTIMTLMDLRITTHPLVETSVVRTIPITIPRPLDRLGTIVTTKVEITRIKVLV
jgi:hypothetical protein